MRPFFCGQRAKHDKGETDVSEENKAATIEIDSKPQVEDVEAKPSIDDLKDSGLTSEEIEKGKKYGLIRDGKEEPKKLEEPKQEKASDAAPKEKKTGNLPEFTFKTPEQEKAWLDAFGPGTEQRAMYFRMKNERQQRQGAEEERDRLAIRLKALEEQQKIPASKASVEIDENGNEIDPEDKPLTLRQLREMQQKEREALEREQEETQKSGSKVAESLRSQEEYARNVYADYDDTLRLAGDLMKNLTVLIPNKWEQDRAIELMRQLQVRAANADKFGIDDYNAALISYEIGKLHPKYGQKADDGAIETPEKVNGGLTPEQKRLERIENNAARRSSSASVTGSPGKRVISAEDVTLQDLNDMAPEQFREFRKKNRRIVERLLRSA